MNEFIQMGGYGLYIWPSYLIAAIIMAGLLIDSITTWRRQEKTLQNLKLIAKSDNVDIAKSDNVDIAKSDNVDIAKSDNVDIAKSDNVENNEANDKIQQKVI